MICLTKSELKELTDADNREEQMQQLEAWGIPFQLSAKGNIKVFRSDLVWSAERRAEEPNYDAA